jgi:lipopolysaccharide/colanic/teichoic acid biosynthesis glycosyltransferase
MASTVAHEAVAATYPDSLFESLTRLAQAQADVQDRAAAVPTDLAPGQLLLAGAGHIASRKGYAFKRGLDIVGAGLALVLLAPLMLLVAAAVAVTSPGPVIYRQTRLGRGGVPFTFYKFRSMTTQADDSLHRDFVTRLIRSGDGATDVAPPTAGDRTSGAFKLAADPRITPLGRFMRRTSIDELPQFFNVLKGDMSLVGPRPAIPYEVVSYQPWHMRRMLSLRPGITGLWQVQGRSRVCFNEMVRMDLRYIRDCSLALDLKILLRTILVVLRCEGAG